ncbi:MAG: HAMP domain-containing sensor histidine kinase [Dehalobacterium sp.]
MFGKKKERHMCFHEGFHRHQIYHKDFHVCHRNLKWLRPGVFISNILILYLIFKWVGRTEIAVFFAVLISVKEIIHLAFLRRLEKRIFKPMDKLKNAVDEIAKGNYHVKVDYEVTNEFGILINSFNEMAQKLQESEKLQLTYEENRKTLIANISHDLKTPIASIQGYIEALVEGVVASPDKINKYLKIIHNNTVYINRLIDDLFLFSKLDMDKLDFQFEVLPIQPYMNDLMIEFKLELEEKQIQFLYMDQTDREFNVRIDRKRLHQAIRNIIGNGVKYGTEKDLIIEVELFIREDHVCIAIKDNGPGIPLDKLPYVFDRFYRIDVERTKDPISTGLGLAIAKELVEAHKGKITVSSQEYQGTCFTVMLPIVQITGEKLR